MWGKDAQGFESRDQHWTLRSCSLLQSFFLPESESVQGKPRVQLFQVMLNTVFSETSCWVVEVADSSILSEVFSSSFPFHSLFLWFLLIETCLQTVKKEHERCSRASSQGFQQNPGIVSQCLTEIRGSEEIKMTMARGSKRKTNRSIKDQLRASSMSMNMKIYKNIRKNNDDDKKENKIESDLGLTSWTFLKEHVLCLCQFKRFTCHGDYSLE
jgi:hypothetical protein